MQIALGGEDKGGSAEGSVGTKEGGGRVGCAEGGHAHPAGR